MSSDIREENRYRELPASPVPERRGFLLERLSRFRERACGDRSAQTCEARGLRAVPVFWRDGNRELSLLEEELAELARPRAGACSSRRDISPPSARFRCSRELRRRDRVGERSTMQRSSTASGYAPAYDDLRSCDPTRNAAPAYLRRKRDGFRMEGDAIDPARCSQAWAPATCSARRGARARRGGPEGAGLARDLDDPRVVVWGRCRKRSAPGGFIAGPAAASSCSSIDARAFVFDTALPPSIALAARVALLLARRSDDGARGFAPTSTVCAKACLRRFCNAHRCRRDRAGSARR